MELLAATKTITNKVTTYRIGKMLATLIKILFLAVLCFTILYPFLIKITSMFMSEKDLTDSTVKLIPKYPTLENIQFVVDYIHYWKTLLNTVIVSLLSAVLCSLNACMVGWGLARYQFRGSKILFAIVIFITILPPQTIMLGLFTEFRDFDIFGIIKLFSGHSIRLVDSLWPTAILSVTGLIFRGGLFIFIMRQFYTGLPKELVEAAKIDGCGHIATFIRIVLPLSTAMLITVLLFSFSWMWSDTIYSSLFYSNLKLFANQVSTVSWVESKNILFNTRQASVLLNTSVLLSMIPLLLVYFSLQKFFVEGIANSGIVG